LIDEALITHSTTGAKVAREFRRALKTRNKLLRDAREGRVSMHQSRAILESLDATYLPLAVALTAGRLELLQALADEFKSKAQGVLEAPDVDISVEYLISSQVASLWSRSELLSAMHKRAVELRDQELSSGVSLVGPHKHDIRILFAGKDSRFFCSQGQQRALILSFKMAQILYHYKTHQVVPLLLLDDVLSELDPARRTNLVSFLKDIPSQIFLTTTDLSFAMDFGDRRLNVFRIVNGAVEEAPPAP
jgi:DNA replication and repair protein RecF